MIYVGISPYKDENDKYCDIIKIGYTKDENRDTRLLMYTSHNPGFKFIFEFPGGTEVHEKRLHQKFSHLLYHKKEWFKDSLEIRDYFSQISSSDEFNKLPPCLSETERDNKNKTLLKKWSITKLLDFVLREEGIVPEEERFLTMLRQIKKKSITPKEIFEDLQETGLYFEIKEKKWEEVEKELYQKSQEDIINNFFETYDTLKTYGENFIMW